MITSNCQLKGRLNITVGLLVTLTHTFVYHGFSEPETFTKLLKSNRWHK